MKTYWGSGCIAPRILTSALDVGEWSASRPGRFTPRERDPDTHWIGRLGGPQSRSVRGGEGKNSESLPGLDPSISQPVAQRYTTELSRLLLHTVFFL
jgi:hypothetical protein